MKSSTEHHFCNLLYSSLCSGIRYLPLILSSGKHRPYLEENWGLQSRWSHGGACSHSHDWRIREGGCEVQMGSIPARSPGFPGVRKVCDITAKLSGKGMQEVTEESEGEQEEELPHPTQSISESGMPKWESSRWRVLFYAFGENSAALIKFQFLHRSNEAC